MIFLFLGGFVLALAIQRWGLDRRIAFQTLKWVGTRPAAIVAGIMGATAFVSMWVSNTATAAMMVPIALSIVDLSLRRRTGKSLAEHGGIPQDDIDDRNLALSLLLGVAYASSIGGLGTIIGSPPNGIFVRFYEQTYGVQISFVKWMIVGVPVMLLFLPLAGSSIRACCFRRASARSKAARHGSPKRSPGSARSTRAERATLLVFAVTVFCWIFRPLLADIHDRRASRRSRTSPTPVIAVAAALALFLVPVDRAKGIFLERLEHRGQAAVGRADPVRRRPRLAAATEANGVAQFIGSLARGLCRLARDGGGVSRSIALMVFMSELTSNTAQVATMLPILAALAPVLGVPPALLLLPATIAASCAFMMPVGTPPNAIVFGTGLVRMPQMIKAGLLAQRRPASSSSPRSRTCSSGRCSAR